MTLPERTQSALRTFLEHHYDNVRGGANDWVDIDPATIAGKTVSEAFELGTSGYVVVFNDHTIVRFGHRVTDDADWPEFEAFTGEVPQAAMAGLSTHNLVPEGIASEPRQGKGSESLTGRALGDRDRP